MNPAVIVLLFCVWLYLAYQSYQRGNMGGAALFLAVGLVLVFFRLRRRAGA